uniref:F-box protein 5 n=1 Tax=Amphiprion percula TaxID=161767 RepID=A0A3P8U848_AMPPE
MKCPCYEAIKASNMEKSSESKVLHLKPSPVKELTPIKAQCSPAEVAKVLFSIKDTSAVHDKENSTGREHDHSLDESFEDTSLVAVYTPVDCSRRTPAAYSLSSTPSDPHSDPNLPILMFQRAVCEELAKSYKKNNKYDWSIVTKVAEDHLLDRVIGGQMGLEYIDIFTSLLSRNMRSVLTNILALLGDMDLISCKKVSRTWRKIICEDTAALSRCRQAEQALRTGCGLTRDVAVSRVVLSCMQTLSVSALENPYCLIPSFNRFVFCSCVQAASSLKQHESLRHCKRCGSPATHSPEVRQAVCTRCLFNFCTRCQETFHGSTPCRTVQPRLRVPTSKKTPIVPGTKRSIRRL